MRRGAFRTHLFNLKLHWSVFRELQMSGCFLPVPTVRHEKMNVGPGTAVLTQSWARYLPNQRSGQLPTRELMGRIVGMLRFWKRMAQIPHFIPHRPEGGPCTCRTEAGSDFEHLCCFICPQPHTWEILGSFKEYKF